MTKKLFILIILLSILTVGWGAFGCNGIIAGRVITSFGTPVADATVNLYYYKVKIEEISTTAEGAYQFTDVVWGKYSLKVEKEGYVTQEIPVSIGESYGCNAEIDDIVLLKENEAR